MASDRCRVLFIAEDESLYQSIQALLVPMRNPTYQVDWLRWDALEPDPPADLHPLYDAILCHIPDHANALALLNKIPPSVKQAPILLLTHSAALAPDPAAYPAGVPDVLSEQDLTPALLGRAIQYAVQRKQLEITHQQRLQAEMEAQAGLQTALSAMQAEMNQLLEERKAVQELGEQAIVDARLTAREARSSATRMEAIINSLSDAVLVYDPAGNVQLANSFAIAILGFDPIRMSRATMLRRVKITRRDGSAIPAGETAFQRAEKGEFIFHAPIRLTNARNRSYDLLSSALPFYIGREMNGIVVVWNDVTRLERLQEEIRVKNLEMQTEQLEHDTHIEVQRQLIRHRELERVQIARDLHDDLLQNLIALNYGLVEAMDMDHKEERIAKLRWLQNALTTEIRDLRAYCNDLRPPILAPFGLEKAIRSHLETLQGRHPELNIQANLMNDGKRLSEETRMALFRAFQELVNNVLRHAQASELLVELKIDENQLGLKIADNGIGFDIPANWVDNAREGHLGILGARERVESLGGTLTLDSQPGFGSRFTIRLPLNGRE